MLYSRRVAPHQPSRGGEATWFYPKLLKRRTDSVLAFDVHMYWAPSTRSDIQACVLLRALRAIYSYGVSLLQ